MLSEQKERERDRVFNFDSIYSTRVFLRSFAIAVYWMCVWDPASRNPTKFMILWLMNNITIKYIFSVWYIQFVSTWLWNSMFIFHQSDWFAHIPATHRNSYVACDVYASIEYRRQYNIILAIYIYVHYTSIQNSCRKKKQRTTTTIKGNASAKEEEKAHTIVYIHSTRKYRLSRLAAPEIKANSK